jgi:MoaA/NifB/PqqE/SkfB family radical SAM enzyme
MFPKELHVDQWKEAFKILKKLNIAFNILLGGEPLLLGEDLIELVRFFKKEGISYAISSNSNRLTETFAEKLISAGLSNWTVSLDVLGDIPSLDIYSRIKSSKGLKALTFFKERGVKDLNAVIVVNKLNFQALPNIVKYLHELGVWSFITPLEWAKSDYYDFAAPFRILKPFVLDEKDMMKFVEVMSELKRMKLSGYRIHQDPDWFDALVKYAKNIDWKCSYPSSLTIDSDGSIRLCYRIKGPSLTKKWTIFDLEDESKHEKFLLDWRREKDKLCQGCLWDCQWQSEYWIKRDRKMGEMIFKHSFL